MSAALIAFLAVVAPAVVLLPSAEAEVTDTITGTAGGGANWRVHTIAVSGLPGPHRTVTLSWDNALTNMDLGVRDATGASLQWSTTPTGTSETISRELPAGTYQVAVSVKSGPSAAYTITVDDTQPPPPPLCEATFCGMVASGAGTSWKTHTIDLVQGAPVELSLDWSDAAAVLRLGVYRPDGVAVGWAPQTKPQSITVTPSVTGTYTIAISAKSGPQTFYSVTRRDLAPCAATFCGTVQSGSGLSWKTHEIAFEAGVPVQVSLDWADPAASVVLGLRTPAGSYAQWGKTGLKPQVLKYTPTVTGTYQLAVSHKSGPAAEYTIAVLRGDEIPPPEPPAGVVGAYASSFGFGPRDEGHAGIYAYGIEWDASSDTVLVGDVWNHRILRYSPTGQRVSTFAITEAGDNGTIEPFDVETGPDGTIYSTSEGLNRIDVWAADGTYLRSIGLNGSDGSNGGKGCGNGAVTWPSHLAVTGGKLYASDGFCGDIFVFDAVTGAFVESFGIPAIAATAFGVSKVVARGLETDQDGNLTFVDHASRRLAKFTPDGDLLPGWPTASDATMLDPRGLSVDLTTGDIYVAAALQNQLYRFNSDGQFILRIKDPVGGGFNTIRYVSATNGDVYVGDTWGHRVWRLSPTGAQLPWAEAALPPPNGGYNQLSGVGVDGDSGRLFGNDTFGNRIQGFDTRDAAGDLWRCTSAADCPSWLSSFGYRAVNSASSDGLNYPRALAAGGGFVFSDAGTAIARYDLDGTFLNRWGTWGSGPSQFITGPTGIDVVPIDAESGLVYTVDLGNCRIMVTDYTGAMVDQMGSCGTGTNQMRSPWQIDVVGDRAYVAEAGRAQIAVWDLVTKQVVGTIRGLVDGVPIRAPKGVQVDPTGTWVYIADTENKRIVRASVADPTVREVVSTGQDTPEGFLNFPRYLSLDAQGVLYVSDFNQRIYAFDVEP